MVTRYEELRRRVTAREKVTQNLGLALFIHRGMRAWMEAWAEYCQPAKKEAPDKWASQSKGDLPADVREYLVMLLVGMTLGSRR